MENNITRITNREAVVNELAEMLMQFDKDMNQYQTDVYMYINAENNTATLDTFVNVGGNSWLNDDHITIYSDKEHYDGISAFFSESIMYADALDIDYDALLEEARVYHDYDDIADVGYCDIEKYIFSREDYSEKVLKVYYEEIDNLRSNYMKNAELILECFIDKGGNFLEED